MVNSKSKNSMLKKVLSINNPGGFFSKRILKKESCFSKLKYEKSGWIFFLVDFEKSTLVFKT